MKTSVMVIKERRLRELTIAMLLFVCLSPFNALAQSRDELKIIQGLWGKEKKTIVQEYMKTNTMENADPFWNVYDGYELERQKLGEERIRLIGNYIEKFKTLTDADASSLVNAILKNDQKQTALKLRYFEKFKKVIPAVQAAQFFQLEEYLQTRIRAFIQDNLPMIADIKR